MRSTMLALLIELRKLPDLESLTVFGPMLSDPDTAVALDIAWKDDKQGWSQKLIDRCLRLGAYPSAGYGMLNLHVINPRAIMGRNDAGNMLVKLDPEEAVRTRGALQQGESFLTWHENVVIPRLKGVNVPSWASISRSSISRSSPTMAPARPRLEAGYERWFSPDRVAVLQEHLGRTVLIPSKPSAISWTACEKAILALQNNGNLRPWDALLATVFALPEAHRRLIQLRDPEAGNTLLHLLAHRSFAQGLQEVVVGLAMDLDPRIENTRRHRASGISATPNIIKWLKELERKYDLRDEQAALMKVAAPHLEKETVRPRL